jgi:MerR family transcriptional regulator, redox-sensitive transcriptional activator SoxR
MTIGDLASKSGVPASTIRYWERIGILPAAARISGQRRYSQEDINRLAVLQLARACGFRLDEMMHLIHGFSPKTRASQRWQLLASKKRTELNMQIAQLRAMRRIVDRLTDCKCAELSNCGLLAASVIRISAR